MCGLFGGGCAVPERIAGSAIYVTHELMNRYLTGIICGGAAMVASVIGATWYLSSQISEVRQDVAVVKVRIENLSTLKPASAEAQQAQYILVQMPQGGENREQTIRELSRQILIKQGN